MITGKITSVPKHSQTPVGHDAIVVQDLVKRYGTTGVVNGLSFRVKHGEVFAVLGPNGAGKTTTVEILEGYRTRDDGVVQVLGLDPERDAVQLRKRIGVMLQHTSLQPLLKVGELVRLFTSYYRNPADADQLIAEVGLEGQRNSYFGGLSGGQKQRLSLALALSGNPEIVFLDEPTAAMDPQARQVTWRLIEALRAKGVTILLTTHYMEEAQRLADRVAIIAHGRLLRIGTPEELTQSWGTSVVRFTCSDQLNPLDLQVLPGAEGASVPRPGVYAIATSDPVVLMPALALLARERNVALSHLRVEGPSLEDVFFQVTEDR